MNGKGMKSKTISTESPNFGQSDLRKIGTDENEAIYIYLKYYWISCLTTTINIFKIYLRVLVQLFPSQVLLVLATLFYQSVTYYFPKSVYQ